MEITDMKIAFTGTHCTGKTTLLNNVKKRYLNNQSFGCISGVARNIVSRGYPLNAEANTESYIHYINDQLIAEHSMTNYKLFISDRTLLDPLAYALVNRELPRPYIQDYFIDMMKNVWLLEKDRYDLYIHFPVEFPMVFDGVRPSDEDYRVAVDEMIQKLLTEHNVDFVTITGSESVRKQKIFEIIDRAS
jgi:nicotinamide riboside kinase